MVLKQLTVLSLTIPEDPGSNPAIVNFSLLLSVCGKDENREKETGNVSFFEKNYCNYLRW